MYKHVLPLSGYNSCLTFFFHVFSLKCFVRNQNVWCVYEYKRDVYVSCVWVPCEFEAYLKDKPTWAGKVFFTILGFLCNNTEPSYVDNILIINQNMLNMLDTPWIIQKNNEQILYEFSKHVSIRITIIQNWKGSKEL